MEISIELSQESKHIKSMWSGGTTTELYIAPKNSTYANLDFKVRISTAQVETEKSSFTSLPGVDRKLMILDGKIIITHQNQYSKQLRQFEVDTFKGDWKTTSEGTCTDFNVMTTEDIESELIYIPILMNTNVSVKNPKFWKTICLYVQKGAVTLKIAKEKYSFKKGDFLTISNISTHEFTLNSTINSQVIMTKLNI
ncbi:MAG: HutD family protein [Flavobacteriaceae bacterium]|nr:HutD family protein [Flavobacteriaceae bacterium]